MEKISRKVRSAVKAALGRGKSILLLGPRQVGKTTLVNTLSADKTISLARPALRQQYERDIESFSQEIEAFADISKKKPLVIVDEIQKIPDLMDAIQDLIDRDIAQFILTGSSARKLRMIQAQNWLPGRVVYFRLDPLAIEELPKKSFQLENLLLYGSLPEIIVNDNVSFSEQDLQSYVVTYLEEEVRKEALVRNIGDFNRFLQLAAAESGGIVNFNRISQDIGVAQTTVTAYYRILEDCLIAERVTPFLKSTKMRRRILKSDRYVFFDLGVRRFVAEEGTGLPDKIMGGLFEQFIGLEILKHIHNHMLQLKLHYWRDAEGREVDWVVVGGGRIIPIEVKWTEKPSLSHLKHLRTFMDDYKLEKGFVICRCAHPRKLDQHITALPWQQLSDVLN